MEAPPKPRVVAIFIAPAPRSPMQSVTEIRAIAGAGLEGDRYATGNGSFNEGNQGKRQVTLMNAIFFDGSGFTYDQSRRNIIVEGFELMHCIGKEFTIGGATFRGVKYCDPCGIPGEGFRDKFFDRGGLIAEIIKSGIITLESVVVPPPRNY